MNKELLDYAIEFGLFLLGALFSLKLFFKQQLLDFKLLEREITTTQRKEIKDLSDSIIRIETALNIAEINTEIKKLRQRWKALKRKSVT